jgi:hypothetical protein
MLKSILFLLTLSTISTLSFAQTKGSTEFGAGAGVNFSVVLSGASSRYRPGLNIGISADHYFSDQWSVKAKLNYDQKGWNYGFIDYGADSYITNYQLNYLSVPVMANWHFGHTRNWYLNFGPYVGFLLNAHETAGDTNVKDIFNTTDAGLAVGIGIKFPITNKARFFVEFLGQGGVIDIVNHNEGYSSLNNSTSGFNVGINF